jgi:acyl-coenzyme A thioesterase PaaI-like protein
MDKSGIARGLRGAVPFNVHLGLEYREIEPGRCVVALPDDERLRNHLGSRHGSGLITRRSWVQIPPPLLPHDPPDQQT